MEWSKVKNIIILVLLLINGFLLVLVGTRRDEVRRYDQAALDQAVQVLTNNGIEVLAEEINAAGDLSPRSAERDVQAEERMAQALLGEPVNGKNQGGGVYSYRGSRGQVSLRSGGELSASMEADSFWQTEDPAAHAAGLLQKMKVEAEQIGSDVADGTGTVTFRQLWDGVPLFSCRVEFYYRENRLVEVSGNLLAVSETVEEEGTVISLPTALLRFLDGVLASGDVCSAIVSMEPGYRTSQSFGSAVRLSPVWLVSSNTADYYLDGVTGELTRITED